MQYLIYIFTYKQATFWKQRTEAWRSIYLASTYVKCWFCCPSTRLRKREEGIKVKNFWAEVLEKQTPETTMTLSKCLVWMLILATEKVHTTSTIATRKNMHALNKQTQSFQNYPETYVVLEYNYLARYFQGAVFVSHWLDYIFLT